MYVTFRCYRTGAHGRMYFRVPIVSKEILSVCEWFSSLNDNHVVVAENDFGSRIATAGLGHSCIY